VPFDVNQVVVEEIARLAQRLLSAQERRAANREDRVGEEAGDMEAGIVSRAEADCDIDLLALEINRSDANLDPHVGIGHKAQEAIETGHQPFGSNRRRGRQAQLALVPELANAPQRAPEHVHGFADGPVQDLALFAQAHLAAGAEKQPKAKLGLELPDLMADRCGGDIELGGGLRET
jgi:hypothetical protein